MTKLTKHPLYLLLVAALVGIGAWSFWPRAVEVDIAVLARAPLRVGFTEEGRTRVRERYLVSAPLDGTVERIELRPGDAVHAGDVVATLHASVAALFDPATRAQAESRSRTANEDHAAARAALVAAEAEQERSAASLQRTEALSDKGLMPGEALDTARMQAAAARAQVQSARARVKAAAAARDAARAVLDLQGSTPADQNAVHVGAPVDGVVLRRYVESAGPVRMGQNLLEIGNASDLEVVAEVLTADAARLTPGSTVRLSRWGGSLPLSGHVARVEPGGYTKVSALGVEEQRTLVVVALDEVPPQLGDGFRVDAEFDVWQSEDALTIPTAALFRDAGDWAAYVVEDGHARLRRLRLGEVGDTHAQVLQGLDVGAQVVVFPGDRMRDGARVQARERATQGGSN